MQTSVEALESRWRSLPKNPLPTKTCSPCRRSRWARWGVGHVWLIDPDLRTLEAYENQSGRWVLLATLKDDDAVRLPPFEAVAFALSALWAD